MAESPQKNSLGWFLAVVAAWFVPQGMHQVLIPWMVAIHLKLSASDVGLAQTTLKLPALLFVLFGGLVADRLDARRILIILFSLAGLPALGLVFLDLNNLVSFGWVIIYTTAIGTTVAFMIPARESVVNRVAGGNIQRTVTAATGIQFGVQLIGFALAGLADKTGIAPLFLILAFVLFCGSFAARGLPEQVTGIPLQVSGMQGVTFRSALGEIREGLVLVWKSPRIFPVVLVNLSIGIFYMGTLFVLVPVLIARNYNGDASDIALVSAAFMAGTILSVILLLRRGGLRRRGMAMIIAVSAGAVLMAILTIPMPFYALAGLHFLWGGGAGVVLSMGRTIVQENAPQAYRARVLSIFSLGFQGGAPLGALSIGYLTDFVGPFRAAIIPAVGMCMVIAYIMLRTDLYEKT